jgi:large subunit ribosomal protein L14e
MSEAGPVRPGAAGGPTPATAARLRPGQLVTSRAGRDRGQAFIVLAILDDRFALVADGRLRRVGRPKRKNIRHLQPHGAVHPALAERLRQGQAVSDRDVRQALADLGVGGAARPAEPEAGRA